MEKIFMSQSTPSSIDRQVEIATISNLLGLPKHYFEALWDVVQAVNLIVFEAASKLSLVMVSASEAAIYQVEDQTLKLVFYKSAHDAKVQNLRRGKYVDFFVAQCDEFLKGTENGKSN